MTGLLQGPGMPRTNTGMEPSADGENVSPEEQAQYENFVSNGMELVYNEQTMPALMQSIATASSPVEGLSNALVMVVSRLEESAKQNNAQIDGEVMMHGATEISEALVELAEAAGIHQFTEQDMEGAFYSAVDRYRESKQQSGELPEAELKQDFAMMQQADQAGQLDQMVPGANEAAQKLGGNNGQF